MVQPETLIGWHRQGFRFFWRGKSRRCQLGCPGISRELQDLIATMHEANPTWGAPRTHGELLKLGFTVAQSALSKYLPRNRKPPVVHALGNAAAYDVALREALDLYRSIGATGHADQLTSELQAWFEALPRLARFASDSACVR